MIIEKIFVRATIKTKTDIHDLIVKTSSKPISLLILLFGLTLAIKYSVFYEIYYKGKPVKKPWFKSESPFAWSSGTFIGALNELSKS